MRAKRVFLSLASAIATGFALVGGCFGVDGDNVSTTVTFRAADGTYRLDYINPPWRPSDDDLNNLKLVVDTKIFGFSPGEFLPPTHLFLASKVNLKDTLEQLLDTDALKDVLDEQNGSAELPDLPDKLPDFDGNLPDLGIGPSDDDDDDGSEQAVPEYLIGVDLKSPRDVATAELNYLIDEQAALLDSGMRLVTTSTGQQAVVYQVTMDPGVFVRNFYFSTQQEALRLSFISLFDLENADIEMMVESVVTNVSVPASSLAAGGAP